MSFIVSNDLVCEYCRGKQPTNQFGILTDEQYVVMLRDHPFDRQAHFCAICIQRLDIKIARIKEKKRLKRGRSEHGTTASTAHTFDPNNAAPNTQSSEESQDARRRRQNESAQSNNSRPPARRPSAAQVNPMDPPPRRNFAAKSTGGRTRPNQPGTSRPRPTSQQQNNSPQPGPSGMQPNQPDQTPPEISSSSEIMPSYDIQPQGAEVPSPTSPPSSLRSRESNQSARPQNRPPQNQRPPRVSDSADSSTPGTPTAPRPQNRPVQNQRPPGTRRSPLAAPTAPMPKDRPVRDQQPHPISPQRQNENDADFRRRQADAHRTFNRGGAG